MQQIIKPYFWILLLLVGSQASWGFALLGPTTLPNGADSWQTVVIGYDLAYEDSNEPGDPVFLGDIGGPRNLSEGYRRNEPVVYYTYDASFGGTEGFFGADGETAVDQAFSIMNAVPAADKINLSLYPDLSMFVNPTAYGSYLTDLKSVALHLLVEQMGLADPERFSWTLHDRNLIPGTTCPIGEVYTVVGRNYTDTPSPFNALEYTPYVNDTLYTYLIAEICAGEPTLADTVTFAANPNDINYSAVAANNAEDFTGGLAYLDPSDTFPTSISGGLQIGYYYTGLTRDDVAGLAYLYDTNNVNWEYPDPDALLFSIITNVTQQAQFPSGISTNISGTNGGFYYFNGTYGYGDYGWLAATSITNSPAALQALYPGLQIASSYNYFGYVTNWVFTQYFTNTGYGSGYPPPLTLVTVSNKQTALVERYVTTFANVFTNLFPGEVSPTTTVKIQVTSVTPNYGAGYPAPPVTNTVAKSLVLNSPSGYFFVLPEFQTNVCPIAFLYRALTNVIMITNSLSSANTNIVTSTNTSIYTSTATEVSVFTNYTWVIDTVSCSETANVINQYQGIGHVQFQRVADGEYDSYTGQFYNPITNYYTMVVYTNYQWQTARFTRIVTQPDILIDASDQGEANTFVGSVERNLNFTESPLFTRAIPPYALAGPGNIINAANGSAAITQFTFDKIGYSVWNGHLIQLIDTDAYLDQRENIPALGWASFNGSTNAPELYPNGTSIQNLQNQLTVNLSPGSPPNGNVYDAYSVQFTASGSALTPPFTWSATPSAGVGGLAYGLPPGLSISPGGTISGTPNSAGTYDFALTLTDSAPTPVVVTWNLSITIY